LKMWRRRAEAGKIIAFVVVGEGLLDKDGNYVATDSTSTDAFGPWRNSAARAEYLKGLVEQQVGVKARTAKLGIAQRAAAHCSSKTDNDEAFSRRAGRRQGGDRRARRDKMVVLVRGDTEHYTCETGLARSARLPTASRNSPRSGSTKTT